MLEIIRNSGASKIARIFLLVAGLSALTSCASHKEPELVSSGATTESALPWNKQEKWESEGQFAGLNDAVNRR